MPRFFTSLGLALLLSASANGALHVPMFFSDGMVLQQGPQMAQVYGTTDAPDSPVFAQLTCASGNQGQFQGDIVSFVIDKEFMDVLY